MTPKGNFRHFYGVVNRCKQNLLLPHTNVVGWSYGLKQHHMHRVRKLKPEHRIIQLQRNRLFHIASNHFTPIPNIEK